MSTSPCTPVDLWAPAQLAASRGDVRWVAPTEQLALCGVIPLSQLEQRKGELARPAELLLACGQSQLFLLPGGVAGPERRREPA